MAVASDGLNRGGLKRGGLGETEALITQRLLQQKGAKIGDRPPLFFGSIEQSFVHVVTECDRDASGLTLQHMQAIIHEISPAVQTDRETDRCLHRPMQQKLKDMNYSHIASAADCSNCENQQNDKSNTMNHANSLIPALAAGSSQPGPSTLCTGLSTKLMSSNKHQPQPPAQNTRKTMEAHSVDRDVTHHTLEEDSLAHALSSPEAAPMQSDAASPSVAMVI